MCVCVCVCGGGGGELVQFCTVGKGGGGRMATLSE